VDGASHEFLTSFPHGALAFLAAFAAGAINSVAGGGTLVSFPALVGLGLPSITANADDGGQADAAISQFVRGPKSGGGSR
jgi:hypothetical protein